MVSPVYECLYSNLTAGWVTHLATVTRRWCARDGCQERAPVLQGKPGALARTSPRMQPYLTTESSSVSLGRVERLRQARGQSTLHEDRAPFERARLLQVARLQCCSAVLEVRTAVRFVADRTPVRTARTAEQHCKRATWSSRARSKGARSSWSVLCPRAWRRRSTRPRDTLLDSVVRYGWIRGLVRARAPGLPCSTGARSWQRARASSAKAGWVTDRGWMDGWQWLGRQAYFNTGTHHLKSNQRPFFNAP